MTEIHLTALTIPPQALVPITEKQVEAVGVKLMTGPTKPLLQE